MTNQIQNNMNLRPFNTFGVEAQATSFARFTSQKELSHFLEQNDKRTPKILILGGGSNVLFTTDYEGLVLKCEIPGITIVSETEKDIFVRAGAGVNWHEFVMYCVEHNFAGVENLVMIPGTCGAAPVQNIGAYGVELKDTFEQLEAFHLDDRRLIRFTRDECAFGYRNSVFTGKHKNEFAILNITLKLSKRPSPNISYGSIGKELDRMGVRTIGTRDIAKAVMNIRTDKLPDPATLGNAGSFFKNPEIDLGQYEKLKIAYPDIIAFPVPGQEGCFKLVAAWLIEKCGWKGRKKGAAGCYDKQPLILVNLGGATGKEILAVSAEIIQDVHKKFGVILEREVNIL